MLQGTVKFYNEKKGFGFIVEEGSNREVFVHATGLIDPIRQADNVTFETSEGKRGINAVNVRKA
ncbi:MAG: cold shock domain-containing protein [Bacteroidia bacterium]|nr:cold shock domain-containing protein [Bacteroidia bacterium]HQV00158.1 cold shock domain-containing protein [Bacteroidia bacterium]